LGFLAAARESGSWSKTALALNEEVHERLVAATGLVSDYMHAFGRSPQFGDSSDGRIVFFGDYFGWDARDHGFIVDEARTALGERAPSSRRIGGATYADSGYAFFDNDRYGVCLCASPVAEGGHGGHNHCDKTSVCLRVNGHPVFVDSGTFSYAEPVARHLHRNSRSHNVLIMDGREQGEISEARVFGRPDHMEARIEYAPEGDVPAWRMAHDGYSRLGSPGAVERIVRCYPSRLEIEDAVEGSGEHRAEIAWNLDPAVAAVLAGGEVRLHHDGELLCRVSIPDHFEAALEEGSYSPEYGVSVETTRIVMVTRGRLPLSARFAVTIEEK
jgi:hypothetical protein